MTDIRTSNEHDAAAAHDSLITPSLDLDDLIAWVDHELVLVDHELPMEAPAAVAA